MALAVSLGHTAWNSNAIREGGPFTPRRTPGRRPNQPVAGDNTVSMTPQRSRIRLAAEAQATPQRGPRRSRPPVDTDDGESGNDEANNSVGRRSSRKRPRPTPRRSPRLLLQTPPITKDSLPVPRVGGTPAFARIASSLAAPLGSANGLTCAICHDIYRVPVVNVPCGHTACSSCSLGWLARKKCCAECREPVATVVHCLAFQQLVDQYSQQALPANSQSGDGSNRAETELSSTSLRRDLPAQLHNIGLRDLGQIPLDYHRSVARETAIRAIKRNDIRSVELCLVRLGARASTRLFCYGAMHWRAPAKPFLDLLLSRNARIDGHRRARTLHCAVLASNIGMLSEMLGRGADANKLGKHRETALHSAVHRCKHDSVQKLLEWGAAIDIVDQNGLTPRQLAKKALDLHVRYCMKSQCVRCRLRHGIMARLAAVTNQVEQNRRISRTDSDSETESSDDSDSETPSDFGSEASFYSEIEYETEEEGDHTPRSAATEASGDQVADLVRERVLDDTDDSPRSRDDGGSTV